MPPSISTGARLPTLSSSARTSRTLDSLRGMKVCPPKPGWPARDVGPQMPVHPVHVDQTGAAALPGRYRGAERREIGGENRRGDEDAHRLTSSEIGSPGPIWKPACGL